MNIYYCYHVYCGMGMSGVVQAETEERAIELLGWESLKNIVTKIGVTESSEAKVWCKEAL